MLILFKKEQFIGLYRKCNWYKFEVIENIIEFNNLQSIQNALNIFHLGLDIIFSISHILINFNVRIRFCSNSSETETGQPSNEHSNYPKSLVAHKPRDGSKNQVRNLKIIGGIQYRFRNKFGLMI